MTNNRTSSCLVFTICALLLAGCSKRASEEIDFGSVKDSVYQHEYFGFHVKLPSEWSVQDQEKRQQLIEKGATILAGEDKRFKTYFKASEEQTLNLLAAFQHPPGTLVPFNPSIMCVAERVRDLPKIKGGKDYLFYAKKTLESSQLKFEFGKEISTVKLGGVDFDVMDMSLKVGTSTVKQKYHAAIMKGYALLFIVSFKSTEDESVLQNILKGISFHGS